MVGKMDVLQALRGFAPSPYGEEHPGLPPAWLHCQPGDTPQLEIWGMAPWHLSIILRILISLQDSAVTHTPTVAKSHSALIQTRENFKSSLFYPVEVTLKLKEQDLNQTSCELWLLGLSC